MKLNPLDHARAHIKKALATPNGFVDANQVASAIHKFYPSCDLQLLINLVVAESILTHGAVGWEKSGMHDAVSGDPKGVPEPAFDAHLEAFQAL